MSGHDALDIPTVRGDAVEARLDAKHGTERFGDVRVALMDRLGQQGDREDVREPVQLSDVHRCPHAATDETEGRDLAPIGEMGATMRSPTRIPLGAVVCIRRAHQATRWSSLSSPPRRMVSAMTSRFCVSSQPQP